MNKKVSIILCGLIVLTFIFNNFGFKHFAYGDVDNILIVCSYDTRNEWEKSIVENIYNNSDGNFNFNVEYLDSKKLNNDEYKERFFELMNLKYNKSSFSAVVTLDDEAFNLIREHIFDKASFLYKHPCLFMGINSNVELSDEENEYISGIIGEQDNLLAINTILEAGDDVTDIYLLLDNSIYSNTVKENISKLKNVAIRKFTYHVIDSNYIEDISRALEDIDSGNSALYICGEYKYIKTDKAASETEILNTIKGKTDAPIYSKLEPYIVAGAVGGIVNDPKRLVEIAMPALKNLIDDDDVGLIYFSNSAINVPIFNFHAVREYKINPLKLPINSIYINKGPFSLLLPKYMETMVWSTLFVAFFGMMLLIINYFTSKKKIRHNRMLLEESIERENIRTDYILTVSHELRTPLNIIMNSVKLLQSKIDGCGGKNSVYVMEKLSYIHKSSYRLLRTVNNLIDVSKIEIGYLEADLRNENIVAVVEDVVDMMANLAEIYNIELLFDTSDEEIITAVNKMMIERAVLNLLSNAIKFTSNGGHIKVNMKKCHEKVIVDIIDDGEGIEQEELPYIFDKFKRVDTKKDLSRKHEGSGLGLYITKSIVELHGGSISVVSSLGEGSVFTINIPIRIAENSKTSSINDESLEYLYSIETSDIDK